MRPLPTNTSPVDPPRSDGAHCAPPRQRRDGRQGGPRTSTGITRRAVLAGAATLPWLGACSPGITRPAGVDLQEGTFSSKFWPGRKVRWRLAQPALRGPATVPPPLVVAFHGRGGDADWAFSNAHIERHVAPTGLAVATVDGGDFYWHRRTSAIDTGTMVIQDLLPLLAAKGLATGRIALIGWSMGAYGALLLASRLGPSRTAGVAAASAALWQSFADSAPGAFDDTRDFARNDVFARRNVLSAMPVRLDCGDDDPFIVANRAFARALPAASATFDAGAHTQEYWTAHTGAQMSWLRSHFH